jgi:hypothetical protein
MLVDQSKRITNYVEVTHAIVTSTEWLSPDGEYHKPKVTNPRLTEDSPKVLRVSVPRKGFTFKTIEEIEEMGLMVSDVWQHDTDKDADRIMLKIEPREDD